jgi:hypothetical protein
MFFNATNPGYRSQDVISTPTIGVVLAHGTSPIKLHKAAGSPIQSGDGVAETNEAHLYRLLVL